MTPIRVLLVEDNSTDVRLIQELLREAGAADFVLYQATRVADSEVIARREPVDVVLTDLSLPDASGLQAVRRLRGLAPHLPLVVLTGAPEQENLALQALKLGAQDYISKNDMTSRGLARALRYAVERSRGEAEVRRLNEELEGRVEERTRLAEERYEAFRVVKDYAEQINDLYNNAACGFHSLDPEGRFVRVNDTELRWLGYRREEVVGKLKFRDVLAPESAKLFDEEFPKFKEKGAARNLEFEMVRRNGEAFSVLLCATALMDASGQFVMSRSTLFDMTERRRAEESLRESESRFRSLAESALSGIVLADSEGKVLYANKSAQTVFGYSERELAALPVGALIPQRFHAALMSTRAQLTVEQLSGQALELVAVTKRGEEFPVELSVAAWEVKGKRYYGGIFRDVTERRVAEANLRFQANILAQVRDAVIATDLDGRITYWSNGAEGVYGHRMVDVIGRTADEVLGAGWLPAAESEAVLAKDGAWTGEVPQKTRDGRDIVAQVSVNVLKDAEGTPVGRLTVARDVTETKRLLRAMVQSEKMAGMGQMAAGVAHELKSPMSVVLGYADLLAGLAAVRPELPPEFAKHIEVIQKHLVRCADLVSNLLDFSRKERPLENLDLRDVAAAAAALIEPYALEKSIDFEKELPAEPLPVTAHKNLLQQVFINLGANGIDAMGHGGKLVLTVERAARGERSLAVVRVRDSGPGIPAEVRPRLFEPFFTTKGPGKGTGLGLWLSRQIVTEAGGVLECEIPSGGGTEFVVTLPLTGDPPVPKSAPARGYEGVGWPGTTPEAKPSDLKGDTAMKKTKTKPRIAVVDDQKDFLELVRTWLSPRYDVECFSSAENLGDNLAAVEPDLLILDVHMPRVDGFTACQRLRSDQRFAFLPIVFLTASREDVDFLKTLSLGANSYLNKPIGSQELNFRIRELLELEQAGAR